MQNINFNFAIVMYLDVRDDEYSFLHRKIEMKREKKMKNQYEHARLTSHSAYIGSKVYSLFN